MNRGSKTGFARTAYPCANRSARASYRTAIALLGAAAAAAAAACGGPPSAGPVAPASPAGSSAAAGAPATTAAPPPAPPGLSPKAEHNLLKNATFDGGKSLPWMVSTTAPAAAKAAVKDGEYCLEVTNKGSANWDVQFRHREMTIQKGHSYYLRFRAHASQPLSVRPKVGMAGPPYSEYWYQEIDLTTTPRIYEAEFTMQGADDPTAELAFHVGGDLVPKSVQMPYTVCVDDVELDDPTFTRAPEAPPPPIANVRVNQVGYLPGLAKIATVKSDSTTPLSWELRTSSGAVAATGKTTVFGKDAAAGEQVHIVDFSAFEKPGKGYTLKVGDDVSHPFDIAPDLYHKLKYQALSYFYHNRSGIEITLPYAGEKQWTRPAGHLSDKSVPCLPGSGCNDSLDVSGGWYDAGDHGKYVVNGGISVWTLMNQYERAKAFGASAADFADGKLNIPENHNKVPDLLDEARWELEFLLKMQVKEGPLAGMVHHKIHDKEWTALATRPDEDKIPRFLHAPSTAATLNMAATAAQAARVFKPFDAAFSTRCITAAETAWKAALAHPDRFAPANDTVGGGAYEDHHVDDEFYWAAAELFITTGKPEYKDFLTKSKYYEAVPAMLGEGPGATATSMTWQDVQALGSISLAVAPNKLPAADIAAIRKNLRATADSFLEILEGQGHRTAFKPDANGSYPWGSNSFALNNLLVMALAYDFGKDPKYLNGVVEGMDYILGRNPLDQSYVTGYGFRPLQFPHHRFWAYQVNHDYPKAPPGIVSGGPNSGLQDPYVQAAGLAGCPAEKCWIDNAEAWSANEITINWNAPLAWVTAFLDEKGKTVAPASKASAKIAATAAPRAGGTTLTPRDPHAKPNGDTAAKGKAAGAATPNE